MEKDIAIIVVLYGKNAEDSTTIDSLLSCGVNNVKLIIHNNGPREIVLSHELASDFEVNNIEVEVVNCLANKPLSVVYNEFIEDNFTFGTFVIFDDDSELTESFVRAMYGNDYDIQAPRIISRKDNLAYYPMTNGKVVHEYGTLEPSSTHSIGSGLILKKSLVKIFQKHSLQLFDEHYALYGVDVSLFRRVWRICSFEDNIIIKSSSTLLHSLSRAEEQKSKFRDDERLIDFSVTARNYPSLRGYLSFTKKFGKNILSFKLKNVILMTDTFFHGNHPRCRK